MKEAKNQLSYLTRDGLRAGYPSPQLRQGQFAIEFNRANSRLCIIISMPSTQNGPNKPALVRVFRFMDLGWTEILTGELKIDTFSRHLKLTYDNNSNEHLLNASLPEATSATEAGRKCIEISCQRLSRIEQDDKDKKIIYFWIGSDPFSMSFLCEKKAKEICQIFDLLSEDIGPLDPAPQSEQLSLQFIKYSLESDPGYLSTLMVNNNGSILSLLAKELENQKNDITEEEKEVFFLIFKTAIRQGGKQIILKIIENQSAYDTVLKALSWNPFNDKHFKYHEEYRKMVNFNNVLGIDNKIILESYEDNARLKFLRDVAACMFMEVQSERVFDNIISENNRTILLALTESSSSIDKITKLAEEEPAKFLQVYIELGEIFKQTTVTYEHREIKQDFYAMQRDRKLTELSIKALSRLLDNHRPEDIVEPKNYDRWMNAMNPYLSYNWQYSQQWLLSLTPEESLLAVLLRIFNQCGDEGVIYSILQFVRWFIQPSLNRIKMEPRFTCFVYNQFVAKIWEACSREQYLVELYVDFVTKIYKIDYVRTRRILIENKVMQQLERDITKKPTLLCIVKLLDTFLEVENLDVFTYLVNHWLFRGLKEEYDRNKESSNMINSCFRSLIKKVIKNLNADVNKYFSEVLIKID